jgi:uncharacterized membrane protein YccF (DUF307 family)
MTLVANLLWLVLGGFIVALGYLVGGLALCLTLVGIPFGLQSMRLGLATLAPFGKSVQPSGHAGRPLQVVFDVLWLLVFGWPIAAAHLVSATLLAITLIGIPFAWQHVKLIPVALFPFGRELR